MPLSALILHAAALQSWHKYRICCACPCPAVEAHAPKQIHIPQVKTHAKQKERDGKNRSALLEQVVLAQRDQTSQIAGGVCFLHLEPVLSDVSTRWYIHDSTTAACASNPL
jgi:hypothetical protein